MERERLQYLLHQHTTGRATSEEVQELNQLDLKGEENRELLSTLLAEGFAAHHEPGFDTTLYDDLADRALAIDKQLKEPVDDQPLRVVHRINFIRKWGWAAAIVIILGTSAYFWITSKRTDQTLANGGRPLQTDIAPGGDKAVLTLADGSSILLDSAANGKLATQGGVQVVKQANGQVVYDLKGGNTKELLWNTMATPRGGQYQLRLPDDTRVWLNASSSITFPAAFSGSRRQVKIRGEVYFEVATNKQKPFIVDVDGKSTVEVLGTSFNINSYADERTIRTTLLNGGVRVIDALRDTVVLKPGQQALENPSTSRTQIINDVDVDRAIAWKNGLFIFNDDDIKSIMRQVSRWYDVEVVYDNPPSDLFMGEISRGAPVSKVIHLLELTKHVHFIIDGKKIIVSK